MKFSEKVKTMSLTQKLLLLVGGLLVILLLWRVGQAIFKEANAKNNRQPAVAVILSPVENGLIRDVGRFSGTLIPKSQFVVAPKVSGKLKNFM